MKNFWGYKQANRRTPSGMRRRTITNGILAACGALSLMMGCTKKFTQMNVNPNAPTAVPATNIFGRGILSSAGTLFGERLDIYYTGSYAGQTAGIGLGDYEYRVDINNSMWTSLYQAMNALFNAA